MNDAILNWFQNIKEEYPKLFWKKRVVEFGALDVNGSPRSKFDSPVEYIGVVNAILGFLGLGALRAGVTNK